MQLLKKSKKRIKRFVRKIREYMRVSNCAEIARRCFAKNTFDGILTVLGILIGGYVGKIVNPKVIIVTGIGAAVAMGVSGIWATYETEKAERALSLQALERATLSSLEGTMISKAADFATVIISIIDGMSPFLAALFVISPFFFSVLTIQQMYLVSVVISFTSLALLGGYLGKLSKSNVLVVGLKMVLAGIVCSGLSILLIGMAT